MPISLPELQVHIAGIGWNCHVDEERQALVLSFTTRHYRNPEGEHAVLIAVECRSDGEFVQVLAPAVYNLADCRYRGPTLAALAALNHRTRGLQCEHDPADGEVRFVADALVLDNTLTKQQLGTMVSIVFETLEEHDSVIRLAMETGRIDFGVAKKREERVPDAPDALPPELKELLERAGGVEELRRAWEEAVRARAAGGSGA